MNDHPHPECILYLYLYYIILYILYIKDYIVFKQERHPLDIKKGSAPTVADFKDFSVCTRRRGEAAL